jgi:hypothetical protein
MSSNTISSSSSLQTLLMQPKQDLLALQKDLGSGNLAGAQKDFAAFLQDLQNAQAGHKHHGHHHQNHDNDNQNNQDNQTAGPSASTLDIDGINSAATMASVLRAYRPLNTASA